MDDRSTSNFIGFCRRHQFPINYGRSSNNINNKRSGHNCTQKKRKRSRHNGCFGSDQSPIKRTPINSCLKIADAVGLREAARGSNFVFSPLSLQVALSLAAAGAAGKTLDQFLKFLCSSSVDNLNSAMAGLVGNLARATKSPASCLTFVNEALIQESLKVKPSFLQTARSVYLTEVKPADFIHKARELEREVNAWVEKRTNGLIKDLIPPGSINSLTRVVLANALYFKGMWAERFTKSSTRDKVFYLLDGSTKRVPFMTSCNMQYLKYYHGFKVLKLPYRRDGRRQPSLSMLFYLPNKRGGLNNLTKMATSDPKFFDHHLPYGRVPVHRLLIPKFKISYKFEASPLLKSFGLELPFSGESDFSEMVSEDIRISQVMHQATLEVDENGTVASAATAMVMLYGSLGPLPPPPPSYEFVADHPFMFAIREDQTGALMFLGHVADPSK